MSNLRKNAKEIAGRGRYGDDSLLHVSKEELRGLASLHPEGKLPKNPDTGLPEAFFFLPFLAGLGSLFGAGTAAAAIPAATTAATAATALPAATAATLGGALGTAALPAAAGTLGATTATALPAATAATLPAATAATTAPTMAASAVPAALTKGIVPAGIDTLTTGATTATSPILANPATATGLPSVAANPVNAPLFDPALKAATTNTVTPSTISTAPASVTNPAVAPPTNPLATTVTPPSTIPGINAVPPPGNQLLGPVPKTPGLFGGDMSQMMQMASMAALMGGGSDTGLSDEKEVKLKGTNYTRGRPNFKFDGDGEHDFFPNDRYGPKTASKRKFASGGLVTRYAEGGLASLDGQQEEMSDSDLIDATREAIINQDPSAQQLIQMFVATFGQNALQDLLAGIQQGDQMSDGMSDSIPAKVKGDDKEGLAALSEGEYVVPADVVSGLGNGSTQAGADRLNGMVQNTRVSRNGNGQQPPAINPNMVMPS